MGINVDEVYAGDNMNAAYVKEKFGPSGKRLKIVDAYEHEFGGDGEKKDKKVVLVFDVEKKHLPLGVMNKNIIRDAFGADTDGWMNKTILVKAHKVNFGGKLVDGMTIDCTQDIQTGPTMGEVAANKLTARMEQVGAADPKHDWALLRAYLILSSPAHAEAIKGDPKDWPASLMGNIKSWLDKPRASDAIDESDIPF